MSLALHPEQLRYTFDCTTIECTTTAELVSPTNIIGQPRGTRAIEFGIHMKSPGYNIYVAGESGTGRTTAIQRFVEERAAEEPVPTDWLYVNNFQTPHKPLAIKLPAGKGCRFRDAVSSTIRTLRTTVAEAFDNEAFRSEGVEIGHTFESRRAALFAGLQAQASQMNAAVMQSPEGFRILPARDGKPLSREQLATLTEEEQTAWKETSYKLQQALNEVLHQVRQLEKETNEALDELVRRVAASVVDVAMADLRKQFDDLSPVNAYLDSVHKDILDNVEAFRATGEGGDAEGDQTDSSALEWFRRYQANVLVDHKENQGAPVIVEYNPTIPRLLGRVEHEARYGGAVVTDFMMLRGGALHAANGGYLVLRARDLFAEPGAWDALKRALVGGAIRPDDPAIRGGAATRSLDPESIPLDLKVILIGPPSLYYYLHESDEDFRSIFKVMADFDAVVERTADNEKAYASFIASLCEEESLRHFDSAAVGRVIEYGSRLAGTQNKLSTRFGRIADLIRESNYCAKTNDHDIVTLGDVVEAVQNRDYLQNRIEMRLLDQLMEGKQLVATAGAVVGQINALSVRQVGEHSFGQASRVTTRTYVGTSGVVQIDREVELAGPIHNKGLMTLVGYLGGQYADDFPLSLAAQITFEQSYGGIDGDSASSTELYALLSSLSEIPIKQSLAVTGSVNQRGEIQAIGGVTQKVEGWFTLCERRGLTGEQGVLIPAANVSDLMLRDAVVEAVERGDFHVWAVETVDQGIEVLTGEPAGKIHAAVKARLQALAETMARFENRFVNEA